MDGIVARYRRRKRQPAAKRAIRRQTFVKAGLSAAAIFVAALRIFYPEVVLDTTTLIVLVVAALPWLGELLESVETPAGTVKYRDLSERVDAVEAQGSGTRQLAEANEARSLAQAEGVDAVLEGPGEMQLPSLVDEYNRVRADMSPGSARTNRMTHIVGQMIAAVSQGERVADVLAALQGGDLGRRLAAYIYLYVRPDASFTIPLVHSIVDLEPKPFGQFWGLRALSRVIERGGERELDMNTRRRLGEYGQRLPDKADRSFELRQIFESLEPGEVF